MFEIQFDVSSSICIYYDEDAVTSRNQNPLTRVVYESSNMSNQNET